MGFMNRLALCLYSVLVATASAQVIESNITVAFFSDSDGDSCEELDTSNALVLTTNTVPQDYTCFNVADIFSQSDDSGFQNDTSGVLNPDPNDPVPRGVYWQLRNRDLYDSKANYSRVWHEQVNETGDIEPGKNAPWILWTYAFEDCKQISTTDDPGIEEDDNPWFASSCQTEEDGECHVVPNPVKSFGIARREFDCETWSFQGSAAQGHNRVSKLGLITAAMATFLFL